MTYMCLKQYAASMDDKLFYRLAKRQTLVEISTDFKLVKITREHVVMDQVVPGE